MNSANKDTIFNIYATGLVVGVIIAGIAFFSNRAELALLALAGSLVWGFVGVIISFIIE